MRTERSDFERWDWKLQIIDGTRRGREVEDVIDVLFWEKDKIRDVVFDEPEILIAGEMSNVRCVASYQIVDGDDAMTFRQKPVNQMRAEKTRTSGDDRNGLGILGHCACVLRAAAEL